MTATPLDFGAPAIYSRWYPQQAEAFEYALAHSQPHLGLAMPTGTGKSLLAYLLARFYGLRTVILTSRIGLAHQYADAFQAADPAFAELHGWRNYRGIHEYKAAVVKALDPQTRIVVTNYAYYLHNRELPAKYAPQMVICDEAADVFSALSGYLSCKLDRRRLERWLRRDCWPGNPTDDPEDWLDWADETARAFTELSHSLPAFTRDWDEVQGIISTLDKLSTHSGRWVGSADNERAFFAKVWPGEDTHRLLFGRGVQKALWLSATLRPKTFDLLRIEPTEYALWEASKHPYPWEIRPVYWIPTIRAIEMRATELDWNYWVERLDQLIRRRSDALGLIHTVSYPRARMYLTRSEFRDTTVLTSHPADSAKTLAAVKDWLEGPRPRVMVSPALTTGWDFGAAQWQAIGKLPWPDSRDIVLKARAETDKEFAPYTTMQAIVQAAGRIVRGPQQGDRGETFIIDDSWGDWFGWKYKRFAPMWWAVEKAESPPPPVDD